MQSRVIGIRLHVDADIVRNIQQINVIKAVLGGVIDYLLIPLIVPVRPEARRFYKNERRSVSIAQLLHFVKVFPACVAYRVIVQHRRRRQLCHWLNICAHEVACDRHRVSAERVFKILARQLRPARVIAQEGDKVAYHILILGHGGLYRIKLML